MNMKDIFQSFRQIPYGRFGWKQNNFFYIGDEADWIFDWIGKYLSQNLRRYDIESHITRRPWNLRGQILHFGDRYTYLNGPFDKIHPSNIVFLSWFHGEPDDPTPAMRKIFEKLPEAEPHVHKFIISCNRSREVLLGQGIPQEKIVYIPLGVDLIRFKWPSENDRVKCRNDLGIPDGVTCIGSFQKDGNGWGEGLEPKLIKGPDIFLKAVETIFQTQKNIIVLLTGPGRGYIKKGLDAIGVPYIHHYVNNYQEIVNYYYALDLYLITSRVEGGPMSLLECWATGVPIISTRMGMPADLIRHGDNGFLCDIEDWKTISELACYLINNVKIRDSITHTAAIDVRQYDWSEIGKRYYYELCKQVIE